MRVAYVTTYDARNIHGWSGTGYYIARSLEKQGIQVEHVGPLKDKVSHKAIRRIKRNIYELLDQRYLRDPEPYILRDYAKQISKKILNSQSDIVFSATANPIAYLDTKKPIIFWADATFKNVLNFYPHYSNLCKETIENWHKMEQIAINKSSIAIYSSDWAARSAIDYYGADSSKVKVIPFGANIENSKDIVEIDALIGAKPSNLCKLLFIGVDWYRKGGDIAFKLADNLNKIGLDTELTIVGCDPQIDTPLPKFVKSLGFISKATQSGKDTIEKLFSEAHFLVLPSRADCTPIVFSEANSFALPCISTNVGGISTIIRNNENGMLFNLDDEIELYCDYIFKLFQEYPKYLKLATNTFHEYKTRLNWDSAGRNIKTVLEQI